MISVAEAASIIQKHVYSFSTVYAPLEDSTGHVLAEKITADRDFPPFDRVMMDGIAVGFDAANSNNGVLPVTGIITAGTKKKILNPEEASEIMTGAVLPDGLDTVYPMKKYRWKKVTAIRWQKLILTTSIKARIYIPRPQM